jgi:hypothetical protein
VDVSQKPVSLVNFFCRIGTKTTEQESRDIASCHVAIPVNEHALGKRDCRVAEFKLMCKQIQLHDN